MSAIVDEDQRFTLPHALLHDVFLHLLQCSLDVFCVGLCQYVDISLIESELEQSLLKQPDVVLHRLDWQIVARDVIWVYSKVIILPKDVEPFSQLLVLGYSYNDGFLECRLKIF